jgi:hypothetical protein
MDSIKNIAIGGIITLVVGGTAFTFSQQEMVDNFAQNTGMSQEEAELYVSSISEEELVSFGEIGNDFIAESKNTFALLEELDCVHYEYEWESSTLSCNDARKQLRETGNTEKKLGELYVKLETNNASREDMLKVIDVLDILNTNYRYEVFSVIMEDDVVEELIMTNIYNKTLLETALESE